MITIIIPLYNERWNVSRYPVELFPVVEDIALRTGEKFYYIFVDDGSKDETVAQLQKVASTRSDIEIIIHETNRGMGSAIKTGLAACNSELIITMDADLTFRPVDIINLIWKYQETHADCISGSPYLEKGLLEEVTPFRLFMSKSVNLLCRIILMSRISCVSPIFRLYKTKVLKEMTITSNNFEINAEIMAKLIIQKKKVVEIPVPLLKRKLGVSSINILREIRNYLVLMVKIVKTKFLHMEWV